MAFTTREFTRQLRSLGQREEDHVSHQISDLRREVSSLSNALRRVGGRAAHDIGHEASDLTDELVHAGAAAARMLGRQAGKAGAVVRADPVPAVVAVIGFALFLNLILGRK